MRSSNSPAPIGSRPEVGSSRNRMSDRAPGLWQARRADHAARQFGRVFSAASGGRPTSEIFSIASSSRKARRDMPRCSPHRRLHVLADGEVGKQRALLEQHAPALLDMVALGVGERVKICP